MSLVEIIIYIALVSILTLLLLGYLLHVKKYIKDIDILNENLIRNSLTIDILRRDLYSSSDNILDWDLNNFVFKKNYLENLKTKTVDIGWLFDQTGVFRIEGNYNYVTCIWGKFVKSKICNKNFLSNLNLFFVKKENKIFAIKIEFNNTEKDKDSLYFNIQKGDV